jgi:hypothetical protein
MAEQASLLNLADQLRVVVLCILVTLHTINDLQHNAC